MNASVATAELQPLRAVPSELQSRRLPGVFGLARDALAVVLGRGTELVFDAGDVLFSRGTSCDALLIVASGSLTVGNIDPQLGTFAPQRTFWPGDAYGSHAYLEDATHSVDGVAAQPLVVLAVSREDYQRARELHGNACDGMTSGAMRRALWDLSGGRFEVPGLLDLVESFERFDLVSGSAVKAVSFPQGCWVLVDEGSVRYGERVVVAGEDVGLDSALVGMALADDLLATADTVLRICDGETLRAIRHVHPQLDVNLHRRLLSAGAQCERRPLLATVDRNAEPPSGPPERIELAGGAAPSRFARVPHRRQQEPMDCGAACLSMVSTYHGLNVPYRTLLSRTSASRFGSSLLDLARAAEALGFIATGLKTNWDGLQKMDLPAIAHLPNDKHFVVVWRVTKNVATVGDPGLATKKMSRAELEAAWNGAVLSLRPTAQLLETQNSQPQEQDRTPIQHLLPVLRSYSGTLWELAALSFLLQICSLAFPLGVQAVVDRIVLRGDVALRHVALAALLLTGLVSSVLGFARSYVVLEAATRIERDVVSLLYTRVMSGLGAVLRRFTASDVMARFGEVGSIRTFLIDNLVSVLIDLVMLLTSALFLLLMSPALAAIAVGFIPLQLVITYVAGRRVHAHSAAFLQRYDRYQSHLMDSLRGSDVIQSHALELPFTQRMKRLFSPTLEHSFRANLASLWGVSLSQTVDIVASALVLWAAVGQVLDGSISIGTMLAFPLMQRQLSAPVLRLANQWRDLQRTRANLERLGGVLDLEQGARQRRDAVLDLPRVVGSIRFQRASLSEHVGERTISILKRVELEIAPGEVVAIVGPSGSGKSSLARLVLRMADPTEGVVSIDGYNLRDVTPSSIREQVGYVTQDTQLFSGTVLENIACGRSVSNEAVIKAAILAGAYEFIQGLPYGLHTQVGERGVPLSGGERQRIVIARALVTDPKILIFDEATAALDPLSERMIHESLRRITSGRTTLIISHRIQAIQHVDRTIVMNEGGISQIGSHASLAAAQGKLYAALVGAVPTWQAESESASA